MIDHHDSTVLWSSSPISSCERLQAAVLDVNTDNMPACRLLGMLGDSRLPSLFLFPLRHLKLKGKRAQCRCLAVSEEHRKRGVRDTRGLLAKGSKRCCGPLHAPMMADWLMIIISVTSR